MQTKITPFLWFDGRVEEAVAFYISVFKNARVSNVNPMSATFELEGQRFMALNGGPQFTFTEAISLSIDCKNQDEVDYYWGKLTAGGQPSQCGWLEDRYGLSWQVNPAVLGEMLADPDPKKSKAVMESMLKMTKIDIPTLERAYRGA